jgi:hypothetical protein
MSRLEKGLMVAAVPAETRSRVAGAESGFDGEGF